MKTVLMAASALALIAAPAFAQETSTVNVTASVESQCGLGNQSGGGTGGHTDPVALGDITDANGQLSVAPRLIGFGNVWCNGPSDVSLTVSPLATGATVADHASFVNNLTMIVDNNTGTGGSIFSYLGTATEARTGTPATHYNATAFESGTGRFTQARLSVALPPLNGAGNPTTSGDRPVAGAYTGTVVLSVTAR